MKIGVKIDFQTVPKIRKIDFFSIRIASDNDSRLS
jgi:hypothetical protein